MSEPFPPSDPLEPPDAAGAQPPAASPQPSPPPLPPQTAAGGQLPPPPPPPPPIYDYAGQPMSQPVLQRVDVAGAVSWAMTKFGQNWQVLLVFAAVIMAINAINNRLSGLMNDRVDSDSGALESVAVLGLSLTAFVITIALALAALIAELGLINASLKITRGERANFSDFWDSRVGVTFVVVAILYGLAVGFGLVLCIIPGLLAMWAWQFSRYAAVDPGTGIGASFGESWRLVSANKGIAVLTLLIGAVGTVVTFLTCGIGALVVQPVITLFMANVYRQLRGEPVAA